MQNFQTLSINFHLPHIFNGDFNSHNKPIMLQQLRRKKKKYILRQNKNSHTHMTLTQHLTERNAKIKRSNNNQQF